MKRLIFCFPYKNASSAKPNQIFFNISISLMKHDAANLDKDISVFGIDEQEISMIENRRIIMTKKKN